MRGWETKDWHTFVLFLRYTVVLFLSLFCRSCSFYGAFFSTNALLSCMICLYILNTYIFQLMQGDNNVTILLKRQGEISIQGSKLQGVSDSLTQLSAYHVSEQPLVSKWIPHLWVWSYLILLETEKKGGILLSCYKRTWLGKNICNSGCYFKKLKLKFCTSFHTWCPLLNMTPFSLGFTNRNWLKQLTKRCHLVSIVWPVQNITSSIISGYSLHNPDLYMIWFDAHADIDKTLSTSSGHLYLTTVIPCLIHRREYYNLQEFSASNLGSLSQLRCIFEMLVILNILF